MALATDRRRALAEFGGVWWGLAGATEAFVRVRGLNAKLFWRVRVSTWGDWSKVLFLLTGGRRCLKAGS
jgi:hypothetical protein